MDFSEEQLRFANDLKTGICRSTDPFSPSVFRVMSSAPGSGKTTTLLNALNTFVNENEKLVDEMLEKEEKILILVFNAKNKKELVSKAKKAKFPDIFNISTINSLMFQELKRLTTTSTEGRSGKKKLSTFSLDYTKSTFSKNMIRFVVESMVTGRSYQAPSRGFSELRGEALPRIDAASTERRLSQKRYLPESFLAGKNINVLWSFVNGYFSSPFHVKDIDKISEVATFFGKAEVVLEDLVMDEDTTNALDALYGNNTPSGSNKLPSYTPEQYPFAIYKAILFRIAELSSFMGEIYTQTIVNDVAVEYDGYEDEGASTVSVSNHTVAYENIFKVPHNFYTKQAYRLIMSNDEVMRDIFGQYKALLNDEAQDNDNISYQIAEALCSKGIIKDVSFIGDENQSIYGFSSPDHFDVLEYVLSHRGELMKKNISVETYSLNKSYRLGSTTADFCNNVFSSDIIGSPESKDFVYPESVKEDTLPVMIKKLTLANKKATCSVICRTNGEATRLFIALKEAGVKVKIESSIKQEISSFFKKGLDYITEEEVRSSLLSVLIGFHGKREKDIYLYEDIKSCQGAVDILTAHGYGQVIKFSADEVQDYILPRDNSRTGVVWVGTAHLFKGAEYDYSFLGTDFFSKALSDSSLEDGWAILSSLLLDRANKEERNILYVAMTRSKKGLFFLESGLSHAILGSGYLSMNKNLSDFHEACLVPVSPAVKEKKKAEKKVLAVKKGNPSLFDVLAS